MMGGMGTPAAANEAPAAQGPAPYLPAPTGPYPVGTTSLWLTDASRRDPWAAETSARELMVSLWYPAVPTGGRRAQYMTPAESELQLTSRGITGVPADALSTVRTNAAVGATDLALLADQVGIDVGADLPGARSLDITRGYVRAFFDQHLRGSPQALLDQPSPRYPEVTFCSPGTETSA
jgi:hypothetical protein